MAYFLLLYSAELYMYLTVWMFEYCRLQHNKQTSEGTNLWGYIQQGGWGGTYSSLSGVREWHGILGGFFLIV